MNKMGRLATALAAPHDQPTVVFQALAELADEVIGARLFTLMTFDAASGEARRIYSNMPRVYPVSGTKRIEPNRWTACVIDRHETFVANTIEDIATVFSDHELIRSLGCESILNVPIIIAGRFVGTINCLNAANHYSPTRVSASEELKLPGAACFLHHAMLIDQGDT